MGSQADSVTRRPAWVLACLSLYGVAVLLVVLLPVGYADIVAAVSDWIQQLPGLAPFGSGWIEFGANILMFAPLGLLLTLLFRHPWYGVALALSVGVEVAQVIIPSRHPSLRDVAANVAGAALGAGIAWLIIRSQQRRRARAVARAAAG